MKKLLGILIVCLLALGFSKKTYFLEWYEQINNSSATSSSKDIQINPKPIPNTPVLATAEKHHGNSFQENKFPIFVIRNLLLKKDFEKLNSVLEDYQKAYEQDVANEDNLLDAYYQAFLFNESSSEALLDEWIKSFPNNYQPYLARASYYVNMGWKARGGKFISETTDNQIEGMEDYFAKADEDIKNVLTKKQNNIVAYYLLINIYKAVGDHDSVKAITEQGLEKCPNSFRIRSAYLLAITPRWHGSYEEMERFATESQQYISQNPRIVLLQGYVYYDKGNMLSISKNYEAALEMLDKAISFGNWSLFYNERADIYNRLKKHDEALADINTAIDMNPQNPDFYYRRAYIMADKNMLQEALNDIEIVERLGSDNLNIINVKSHLAYSYEKRARTFIDQKDLNSALTEAKTAIEFDPNNIDHYILIDWILAYQSRNWDEIIKYWNQYLNSNPNDGRAYLERGGAYFQKRDVVSAVADAKRSAELGNADGQKMYDKIKGLLPN